MDEKAIQKRVLSEKIRGFYDDDEIIKVITGVKRCGKSSLMELVCSELREKGVPEEQSRLRMARFIKAQNKRVEKWEALGTGFKKSKKERGKKEK